MASEKKKKVKKSTPKSLFIKSSNWKMMPKTVIESAVRRLVCSKLGAELVVK